jgi:hypothetical protein
MNLQASIKHLKPKFSVPLRWLLGRGDERELGLVSSMAVPMTEDLYSSLHPNPSFLSHPDRDFRHPQGQSDGAMVC